MPTTESTTMPAVDGQAKPRFADLGLSDTVMQAVSDLGYEEPTPVQAQAIPYVLEGRDLLAAAQTGTGKTAAFLLPSMSRLPRGGRGEGPSMLVVTPTRELAQQIQDVCSTIEGRTHHRSFTVVGGVGYEPQKAALRRGCDVLVATPGRLVDLIEQGECDLSGVSTLVLDEADRMLDMGFLPAMRKIVGRTPDDRQTLLFSATLDEKAIGNIRDLVEDPAVVEIAHRGTVAETIDQFVLPVSLEAKNGLLPKVLEREGTSRVIVFCRTKHRADACCRRLRRAGISCAPIHGNRSQNQRERALASFRTGDVDVLVATDVLARGIDVTDVRYVVNFDVPADPEDYIHRIGRTGRAGETGWALTFVTVNDFEDLLGIERLMGQVVPDYDNTAGLELGEQPPALDPDRSADAPNRAKGKGKSKRRRGGRKSSQRHGGEGPDVAAASEAANGVDPSGALLSAAEVKALEKAAAAGAKGSRGGKSAKASKSSDADKNNETERDSDAKGSGRGRRRGGSKGRGDQPRRQQGARSGQGKGQGQRTERGGERGANRDANRGVKAHGKGKSQSQPQAQRPAQSHKPGGKQRRRVGDRLGMRGNR